MLGRLDLLRGGQSVELPPSKKARALLAYVVASGRSHPRDTLASLLWDEREDGRGALRWALSRLRALFDSGATQLVADRDEISFERGDAEIDLAAVRAALRDGIDRVSTETLEAAAARFRGEFLEGLDLADCYAFHAWCVAEREAARALRGSILSTLVQRLAASDPERALPFARARLDLDPLAGGAQAAVVRVLGVLGRTREAEELYQSFKQLLHTRLGERTSIELERARLGLRAAAPVAPAQEAPLARLERSPFVGRAHELEALTSALDAAVAGHGALVELSGEAGVGKSRVVEELAHQARLRGARVLVGRCLDADASPAYLPFLDSLDGALGDDELERLAGVDTALAARLLPRLGKHPAVAGDATSERYLVFQALATLLERVAAPTGAVLVIEDLHWIDQPSLALLRYLAGRLYRTRLLVVATYRDEGLDERHRDAIADVRRQGAAHVALRGLAHDEIRTMIGTLVPPALCDRLARETSGHPLFLQEMLKHLVEEPTPIETLQIPETVRQVIERRLARLSDRARRLLTVAAPMVGAFRWELVRDVSSTNEDELLDALEEVLAAQLLRESVIGGVASYEFSHALVAQTLHDGLPVPRRLRLHRQIGDAIERLHASDLDAHVATLAHHFYMARSEAKAIEYALRAAERASSLIAFEEAARHYARAIELLGATAEPAQLAELHRKRGSALAIVSAWKHACEAYETALQLADPDAREWRAEVLVELGTASLWAMDIPAVVARARAADELVASLGRPDLTLAVGGMAAQCLASDGKLEQAIDKYAHVRALHGDRGHAPSLVLGPLALYWNGRIAESIAWASIMLDRARSANDIVALLIATPPLGMALASAGRYREALDAFAEARRIGERARAHQFLSRAVSMSAGLHLDLGDFDTAEDLATEARELARIAAWTPGDVSGGIDVVTCRLRRGDVATAERLIGEIATTAANIRGGFHDWLWAMRLEWARAEVAVAKADRDAVEKHAAATLAMAAYRRPKYEIAALVTRARVRPARDALADLDRALAIARPMGDPALFIRAATPRLALDGSDALAAELRTYVEVFRAGSPGQTVPYPA